ncbi:hypothetical protein BURK1_03673 [Burkholderiales bacterium]|nr:hypothetical protein BURK1_03673 [Burkholderiales bacterium]
MKLTIALNVLALSAGFAVASVADAGGSGRSASASGASAGSGHSFGRVAGGQVTSAPGARGGSWSGRHDGSGWRGGWRGGHDGWRGGRRYGGHDGWRGSRWYGGWGWWGWPAWGATIGLAATWPWWSGAWAEPYAYSYGAPVGTVIYRSAPEPAAGSYEPMYRLYCPATSAFYPDVLQCSQQWLKVIAEPSPTPAAPSQPQSAPESLPPPVPPSQPYTTPPAVRPSWPSGSRGYDVGASLDSPYARTGARVDDRDTAMSPAPTASIAARDTARAQVASIRLVAAPRAELPRRAEAPATVALAAQ